MIQWDAALETGIEEIDSQHKEIFARVNKLFEAHKQKQGKEETAKILEFLGSYVVVHFNTEERFMEIYKNYPDKAVHIEMHRQFAKHFMDIQKSVLETGITPAIIIEVNREVVEWLFKHIAEVDKQFAAYIKSQPSP